MIVSPAVIVCVGILLTTVNAATAAPRHYGGGAIGPRTAPSGAKIAVAVNADGREQVFMVGSNHQLYTSYQRTRNVPNSWTLWTSLGGNFPYYDAIGIGRNVSGRLQLFMIGGNDSPLLSSLETTPNVPTGWTTWSPLAGGGTWKASDDIAVASNADGHLQAFLVGDNSYLYTTYQTPPNNGWHSYVQLGANQWPVGDAIGVGRNVSGKLQLFMIGGSDGPLLSSFEITPNVPSGWTAWSQLANGGIWKAFDDIAVASNADGHLQVFLRGDDLGLYTSYQTPPNNGWHSFVGVGNTNDWSDADAVGVGRNVSGKLQLFLIGSVQAYLWSTFEVTPNVPDHWYNWSAMGNSTFNGSDDVAVSSNADGHLQVFLVAFDNNLYTTYQTPPNNGWSGYVNVGGTRP